MPAGTALIPTLTGTVAVALAAVHLYAGRLPFLSVVPRSAWLSAGGGVSVGYVFVHVLPTLAERGAGLRSVLAPVGFLEHHVYLVALAGFVGFYGLEQFVRRSSASRRDPASGPSDEGESVFWIHVGSFALYNALIGYLLVHRESEGLAALGFYAGAMGLHFVVNDHGLREHHRDRYHDVGRWVLAVAVLVGWGAGVVTTVHGAIVDVLFALLAGGVVLNVIKEELPAERQSRFWAFALGTLGYAGLLLLA